MPTKRDDIHELKRQVESLQHGWSESERAERKLLAQAKQAWLFETLAVQAATPNASQQNVLHLANAG